MVNINLFLALHFFLLIYIQDINKARMNMYSLYSFSVKQIEKRPSKIFRGRASPIVLCTSRFIYITKSICKYLSWRIVCSLLLSVLLIFIVLAMLTTPEVIRLSVATRRLSL